MCLSYLYYFQLYDCSDNKEVIVKEGKDGKP